MRHDPQGERTTLIPGKQLATASAMTTEKDNDTSVQPQPCRNVGSRNGGGRRRTLRGLDSHEEDIASLRLIDSRLCKRGVENK